MKILFPFCLSLLLIACGLFSPAPLPSPKMITGNLNQIAANSQVSIVNLVPLEIPSTNQTLVNRSALFRTATDVRAYPSNNIIIPQNSLLVGIYTNNSKECQISWQALYGNYRALEVGEAVTAIADKVNNTYCDPKLGVRVGTILNLTFK